MFAVIESGGKQYRVSQGDKVKVEKLPTETGVNFIFDKVLLLADGEEQVSLGRPYVVGAKVEGEVVQNGRSKKVIVFRYHSKTRYRKKKGHRQAFTEVKITKISGK